MNRRLSLLPLLLALAACSPSPDAPPSSSAATGSATTDTAPGQASAFDTGRLSPYHWRLELATAANGMRIDALFVRDDQPVQLDFADDRIAVAHTCNRMGGSYDIDDGRLVTAQMTHTMMACAEPLMKLDDTIGRFLDSRPQLQLQDGDAAAPRLTLVADNGDTLVFAGEPTAETRYGSAGSRVFLEVDAREIPAGDASCRAAIAPDADTPCLRVRERHYDAQGLRTGTPGPWQAWGSQAIDGYNHPPGVRNVLRVKRFPLRDAPAGAATAAYVLDMVVESETVDDGQPAQ